MSGGFGDRWLKRACDVAVRSPYWHDRSPIRARLRKVARPIRACLREARAVLRCSHWHNRSPIRAWLRKVARAVLSCSPARPRQSLHILPLPAESSCCISINAVHHVYAPGMQLRRLPQRIVVSLLGGRSCGRQLGNLGGVVSCSIWRCLRSNKILRSY